MGGDNSASKAEQQNAAEQSKVAREYLDFSKQRMASADQLIAPQIDYDKALASGDYKTVLSAMAQPIGQITAGNKANESAIYNMLPPGAARDYALASNLRDKGTQISSTINQGVNAGRQDLTNIGLGQQGVALQQTGAGLNSFQGANSAYNNVAQQQAARKAAMMGPIGALFGAAGTAAGGGAFGKL